MTPWLPEIDDRWLLGHRAHDVAWIHRRWKAVAKAARLRTVVTHEAAGFPVPCFTTRRSEPGALYISAGVHGDEPGAVMGLLVWAEANLARLAAGNAVIFPLFNPVGLALNTRVDSEGRDLNRSFHDMSLPHISTWRAAVEGLDARLAICLHEDYDAVGNYCYELNHDFQELLADRFLGECEHLIPRDPRRTIEGTRANGGVIRRKRIPVLPGLPEAIALYHGIARATLTFETPSEYSLAIRARAQARFVESAWRFTHGDPVA